MNVSCPECGSVFRVDPERVPLAGVRARCSVCGGIIALSREPSAVAMTPVQQPTQAGAQVQGSEGPASSADGDVGQEAWRATPTELVATARPESPSQPDAATPASTSPGLRSNTPLVPPAAVAPAPAAAPISSAASAQVTPAQRSAADGVAGQTPRVGPRRVNPYLNNDPAQRARRLARALVSDLVAYHPEKREEGLRAGTLKELFRDDIRKSWQEYVEQVGAPVAENTPHFQDALNDILASGRRVF